MRMRSEKQQNPS